MQHYIFLRDAMEWIIETPLRYQTYEQRIRNNSSGSGWYPSSDWGYYCGLIERLRDQEKVQRLKNSLTMLKPLTIPGGLLLKQLPWGTEGMEWLEDAVGFLTGEKYLITQKQNYFGKVFNVLHPQQWLDMELPDFSPQAYPFIDLAAQQQRIRLNLETRVLNVLSHGRYIMGPEIQELEKVLADYVGTRYAITCSSGTDALLMALMALNVRPGDAIFTTPFTFFATVETIVLAGGTPVFVDIDPATWNMDPDKLRATIMEVKSKGELIPKGILPVDLFGLPADYTQIREIAEEHHLWILEDAAQAFGAQYNGKRCPSFGDIGATSFFPAKPLGAYGDAGAVFTDREDWAEVMTSIRIHGQGDSRYNNVRIGLNARMDTLQAAILLEKFAVYEEEVALRQQVAEWYLMYLTPIAEKTGLLKLPYIPENTRSVWAQFSVESPYREQITQALQAQGIPTMRYYPIPMHLLTALKHLHYKEGDFPCAEHASRSIFSLPFHPYITEQQVAKTCGIIAKILGTK